MLVCSFYYQAYCITDPKPARKNSNRQSTCCKIQTSERCNCSKVRDKTLLGLSINDKQLSYNILPLHKKKTKTLMTIIPPKKKGFIVVEKYSEQQMGAALSLFTLCKWAKYIGASPVEPFVTESEFRLPLTLSQSRPSSRLRFRDYFNITHWNKVSSKYGAAQLVSWNTFLKLKSTKMIFAILLCDRHIKVSKSVFVGNKILEESKCKEIYLEFIAKRGNDFKFILKLKMVRIVCMLFYSTVMHISEFSKQMYGKFKASEVVVWIHKWNGILQNTRIRIYEEEFHRTPDTFKMISMSSRILKDSKTYVEQVLKSHFGNYIGISFRSARRACFLDKSLHFSFFQDCIEQLKMTVSSVTTNMSEHKIFLAQDLGRFGDTIADKYMSDELMTTVQTSLFQAVYNDTMTMKQWEQTFVSITDGITDSGYIAAMQNTILKNSRCLIMFGGMSKFQASMLYGYKQSHQNSKTCIYEVCYKHVTL